MTYALIAFILFMGIVFIFLEVFVIPGTTVFALIGAVCIVVAIVGSYTYLGTNFGHLSIVVGFSVFLLFFFLGRRLMDKNQLSLQQVVSGKVNEFEANVQVGDEGLTFTDVKPNGKAIINDEKVEVYSNGEYIEKDQKIKVIKINQNKIIIKPLNT
jgi:membrane-bound ClpP family serine protease